MNIYALSDLHLGNPSNRAGLAALPALRDDWLILAGDIGETAEQLEFALQITTKRFAQVLWVPGNHDLWTITPDPSAPRGEAKYRQLVALCRQYGVLTPEDPFAECVIAGQSYTLAPLFVLYDYSFRPADVPLDQALAWAEATGVVCSDEYLLHPDPYPSRAAWCAARVQWSERRLSAVAPHSRIILINHFPLRQDLLHIHRIPRFSLWCGTRLTEDWHTRFPVAAVIYGHLHMRATEYRDGVRFEEVSLGYPRDWSAANGVASYLRRILPLPTEPAPWNGGPFWQF